MIKETEDLTQNTNAETSTQDQTNNDELNLPYFKTCTFKQFQSGEVFEKLRQILKQDSTGVTALTVLPVVAKAIKENPNIPIAATQFTSGFKAYQKQVDAREKNSKSTGQNTAEKTRFPNMDGRPQLVCKNYVCDKNGIAERETGKCICENTLLPTATLVSIDENGIEKIEISFKDHKGRWRSQVLPCSMAYSRAGVITLADAGAAVTSRNAEAIAEYLCHMVHTNGENLPEKKCISRAGWYTDPEDNSLCFYPYAMNGKEVVNGAFGNSRSTLSAIHTKGSKEAWLEMVKPLRTQNMALRAYLCASFASPLLSIVGGNPFFVHLYGETSAGKTVALKLCASVWGTPVIGGESNGKYIHSLSSTENSLEFLASSLHNLPCCLDELQSRGNKETDSLVYRLTQGTGRERLTKAGALNNAALGWKNIILTNGEHALNGATAEDSGTTSGAGAIGRTLNLLVDMNLIRDPKQKGPEICYVCDRNYGHAGKNFILDIIDRAEEIRNQYKDIKMRISPKTDGPVSKQFDGVALLILADALSSEIIFGDEASKDMEDYLLEMIRPTATMNAHALALDWLQGFVVQNSARFTRHKDNEKTWHHNSAISYIGSITDTEISINKRIFADEYNRQFKNSSCALFLKWAEEKGILYAAAKRKDRMRKYIPNDEEYPSYVFWRNRIFPEKGYEYTGTREYMHECEEKKKKTEAEVEPKSKIDDDFTIVWEDEPCEQEEIGSDF